MRALILLSNLTGHGVAHLAERLMTPTADDRGGGFRPAARWALSPTSEVTVISQFSVGLERVPAPIRAFGRELPPRSLLKFLAASHGRRSGCGKKALCHEKGKDRRNLPHSQTHSRKQRGTCCLSGGFSPNFQEAYGLSQPTRGNGSNV
jgi:hypothetical protein